MDHNDKSGELDERGFIFLDANSQPYWCRIWGGAPWLFYLDSGNMWVSVRRVTQMDIWSYPHNLSENQQNIYRQAWERKARALMPEFIDGDNGETKND